MTDLFARVGLLLEALLGQSTLNGDVRAEGLRLAEELKGAEVDFAKLVADRVRAEVEAVIGRLEALEDGKRRSDAVVFSNANLASLGVGTAPVEQDELDRIRDLFNGANPALFDRDGDGAAGGSLPVGITEDPDEMTVPMLKEALTGLEVGFPADARKPELQKLLKDKLAAGDTVSGVADAPDLSAGHDSLSGT